MSLASIPTKKSICKSVTIANGAIVEIGQSFPSGREVN